MSFVLFGSLLLILFNSRETISCPTGYNPISTGCYKINNGSTMTWSQAREYCYNDSRLLSNVTEPNSTTHLLALEYAIEKNSLFYWMFSYNIGGEFWIDGIVSSSLWSWSNQSISWFFDADTRAIIGNGINYKLIYNGNSSIKYQITDANQSSSYFICEYQVPCNGSDGCRHSTACYMNLGQNVCICAPGYTGQTCETELDECLSSPCQHGGKCADAVNNYTCDCSNILYTGSSCEIPEADPTKSARTAAFWSVVGIISGLIVILTLSDLPWEDILTSIGCSFQVFKFCSKEQDDEDINDRDLGLSDSPTNDQNLGRQQMSRDGGTPVSKGMGYHVMNTVWNPDLINYQTPRNPQYNGYLSPDQNATPDNTLAQSGGATKQKQNQFDDKRVYAVDIDQSTKSTSQTKDPADTMVSWTQQLQEQLRNKKGRETSASSTKQLIHSSYTNDD